MRHGRIRLSFVALYYAATKKRLRELPIAKQGFVI